jgi:hypothetical protein
MALEAGAPRRDPEMSAALDPVEPADVLTE